jgi:hypothetical protein
LRHYRKSNEVAETAEDQQDHLNKEAARLEAYHTAHWTSAGIWRRLAFSASVRQRTLTSRQGILPGACIQYRSRLYVIEVTEEPNARRVIYQRSELVSEFKFVALDDLGSGVKFLASFRPLRCGRSPIREEVSNNLLSHRVEAGSQLILLQSVTGVFCKSAGPEK